MSTHPYTKALSYLALAKCNSQEIERLRNAHDGESVFVFGTGPSLRNFPIEKGAIQNAIYLNNAIKLSGSFGPIREYVCLSDHLRMQELRSEVIEKRLTTFCTTDKIFNCSVSEHNFAPPVLFTFPKLQATKSREKPSLNINQTNLFSRSINRGVYIGKTVLMTSLQVAYHLGFKEINLVGIDMTSNLKSYYSDSIKSNWTEFDYVRDAKSQLNNFIEKMSHRGVSVFDHSTEGKIDVVAKFMSDKSIAS